MVYCRFLQHFALSSIGQEPIMYDHLGVLFPSAELRNPGNDQGDKVSNVSQGFVDKLNILLFPTKIELSSVPSCINFNLTVVKLMLAF